MIYPTIYKTADAVVQGFGLKTSEVIPAGTIVWRMDHDQPVYSAEEIARWRDEEQEAFYIYGFQVGENLFALSREIDTYTNHSCEPNLWWTSDGTVALFAIHDIHPGEELTYDYATENVLLPFRMECQCGSPLCRGVVTNEDYRDPGWQQRYGPYLPPHVRTAIDAMILTLVQYVTDQGASR